MVLIGDSKTGKSHVAAAHGVHIVGHEYRRVHFLPTAKRVTVLEHGPAQGRAGKRAEALVKRDVLILDALGYLPFSTSGDALLFHILTKRCNHTRVGITTNLCFAACAATHGDPKLTAALPNRPTHRCYILATSKDG